jgi:hypothetical protein
MARTDFCFDANGELKHPLQRLLCYAANGVMWASAPV